MSEAFEITWSDLNSTDWLALGIFILIAILPYIVALKQNTSLALATVLSLLLVAFYQMVLDMGLFDFNMITFLSVIPALSDPYNGYRMISAGWLHADWIHVLGNILVIALAGVPLEQRMGGKRWMAIYIIGLLGGNMTWIITHPDSYIPAIGASGAAFGILGAYMACWPNDKIEFPLLFFIRAWPVWMIVAFRLGLEVYNASEVEQGGFSNIAHLAHMGGFMLAWALARIIAKGAPSTLDDSGDSTIAGSSLSNATRDAAKARMGDLNSDPWHDEETGKALQGEAARVMRKLREEGDELETRRAWLEELAEQVVCPICDAEVFAIGKGENYTLKCSLSKDHLNWP